jgi:hypothetical protein
MATLRLHKNRESTTEAQRKSRFKVSQVSGFQGFKVSQTGGMALAPGGRLRHDHDSSLRTGELQNRKRAK